MQRLLETSRHTYLSFILSCCALICACRTNPPPASPQAVPPTPPATTSAVVVDDIPPDALPATRAHLIKLREMRDLGQLTNGEYQSRKAALLGR